MGTQIPTYRVGSFTYEIRKLLRAHGWYNSMGWRENSDRGRGYRPGLSEGEVVDEMIRREWREFDESDSVSS